MDGGRWLHNNVHVLNATELSTLKMVKNGQSCIFLIFFLAAWHVDLSSLTRDQTCAPCSQSVES